MLRLLSTVVVAIAATICGAMWALSSPVGSSPDDGFHQTTIWCVDATSSTIGCTVVGESSAGGRVVDVPTLIGHPHCFAFVATESAACQEPMRGERVVTEAVDNGQYPGGFYRVMSLFIQDSIPESILFMRMLNVAIATLLLGGVAIATSSEIRRLMAYTLAPVLIPLGWFLVASVNPSGWSLTGLTTLGFAWHTVLSVPRQRRRVAAGVLGAAGLVLALSARGDAAVYACLIVVALCILHWNRLRAERRLWIIPALVIVVCAWRTLAAAQVASIAGADAESDRTAQEVLANLLLDFPALISGMFGYQFGLGWLDTPVHAVTAYPMALVIGFLVLGGLGHVSAKKVIACLVILGPMLVIPLVTLFRTRLIILEGVQPRYLLPLMPMLLALLLTGRGGSTSLRLTRTQATAIWLALTVANAAAIYANLRRYVTGTDGPTVIGELEWWWQSGPSPTVVTVIGGLSFAVFAIPMVVLSWRASSQEIDRATPPLTDERGAGSDVSSSGFGGRIADRDHRREQQPVGSLPDPRERSIG